MKFKTVVITKKKLAVFFAVCLSVPALAAAVKFMPEKTVSVFKTEDNIYEDILSEGLPNGEEKSLNIKSVLSKILGFDIDEPETIISEYSPVFDGTTSAGEEPEEIDEAEETPAEDMPRETAEDTAENTPIYEPPLPDKEQIDTAVNLQMNNATEYDVDLSALCANELPFEVNSGEAQVLVIHTHTTECYDGDQMNGETERSIDDAVNVIAVGNEICAVLEENGIKTIHDTTYHDYPSYQGSYTRALSTIETQLANNPSIQIVLDIHRDAFVYSDGSKLAVTCEQNGISAAQVMLVVGTNSMGLWHDNWQDNLTFAAKIQNAAEIMYPGLMRPINLRTERFNEHMTKGSLILEVGSNGNTLSQAKEGARYVARAIAAVLNAK
ncbi:MAG: stage II sporulation protein P [Firmicutes bacterium]|nr:stage II sporulation protein P [Bacillota bacterium]